MFCFLDYAVLCYNMVVCAALILRYRQNKCIENEVSMTMKNEVLVAEPLLFDVKTTARMLNVCERTIRTLTKMGELPVVKILGRVLYKVISARYLQKSYAGLG